MAIIWSEASKVKVLAPEIKTHFWFRQGPKKAVKFDIFTSAAWRFGVARVMPLSSQLARD